MNTRQAIESALHLCGGMALDNDLERTTVADAVTFALLSPQRDDDADLNERAKEFVEGLICDSCEKSLSNEDFAARVATFARNERNAEVIETENGIVWCGKRWVQG